MSPRQLSRVGERTIELFQCGKFTNLPMTYVIIQNDVRHWEMIRYVNAKDEKICVTMRLDYALKL